MEMNGGSKCSSGTLRICLLMIAAAAAASSNFHGVLAQSRLCRTSCGGISIRYPFGIDDGCGSPEYRSRLACIEEEKGSSKLHLRTPTGSYAVKNISYVSGPHLIISDSSMWSCNSGKNLPQSQSFSLDASTRFSISVLNNFLFFNCNPSFVLVQTPPTFCQSQPSRCGSMCDITSYLCRNLPHCSGSLPKDVSCCSYFPRNSASLRIMLQYCQSYTSVFWDIVNASAASNGVPTYGVRLNFEVPVTAKCTQCRDAKLGGGVCGYDTASGDFSCLCEDGNSSTYCTDTAHFHHASHSHAGVIAGTVVAVVIVGIIAGGIVYWYMRKKKVDQPIKLGVVNSRNGFA